MEWRHRDQDENNDCFCLSFRVIRGIHETIKLEVKRVLIGIDPLHPNLIMDPSLRLG